MVSFKHTFLKLARIKDDIKAKRTLKKRSHPREFLHQPSFPSIHTPFHQSGQGKDMKPFPKHNSSLRQLTLSEYSQYTAGWQILSIWKLLSMETKLISCKSKPHTLQILISFISWSSKSQHRRNQKRASRKLNVETT